jgi:hypothetical protein
VHQSPLAKALALCTVVIVAACSSDGGTSSISGPSPTGPAFAKLAKVTVCHAAGRAGTTKYVSITVSANGAAAHIRDNGTAKAGHELDYIATERRPCNAPEPAQLTVCVLSSGFFSNPLATFDYVTSEGATFTLHFTECNGPEDVYPGDVTIVQAPDPLAPGPFSYFATGITVNGGLVVSSTGFANARPLIATAASETVTTVSGQNTIVTFYNRN